MQPNDTNNHSLPSVDSGTGQVPMTVGVPITPRQMSEKVQSAAAPTTVPLPSPAYQAPTAQPQPQGLALPLSAEDVDLIEKAWVEKAKAIVQGTTGNPYLQSLELSKVKADYIRKRYNKDIKVAE